MKFSNNELHFGYNYISRLSTSSFPDLSKTLDAEDRIFKEFLLNSESHNTITKFFSKVARYDNPLPKNSVLDSSTPANLAPIISAPANTASDFNYKTKESNSFQPEKMENWQYINETAFYNIKIHKFAPEAAVQNNPKESLYLPKKNSGYGRTNTTRNHTSGQPLAGI
uniref:Uncharacterized protein n=1 Tax=Romanomermis culicivorax TaxID=13658 RepID=A0A915JXA8_ROMCU